MRLLLTPPLRLWFRLRISGAEHIPAEGAAIIAPNHKSFMDVFFLALGTRRNVRYMAKMELFRGPLAWLFPRLGAFPVRRGLPAPRRGPARSRVGRTDRPSRCRRHPSSLAGTDTQAAPCPGRVRTKASELGDSPAALTELIDRRVWPAVAAEYGRLRAAPGLIAAALAAVGMGALVVRRQRQQARPRLLGIVEAKKLRRRKARSRLWRTIHGAVRRRT